MSRVPIIIFALAVLLAVLFPSPISPEVTHLPVVPLPVMTEDLSQTAQRMCEGMPPPESFVELRGKLFASLGDGSIAKFDLPLNPNCTYSQAVGPPAGCRGEEECGRPLGMVHSARHRALFVCDAHFGLLKVDEAQLFEPTPGYQPEPLVTHAIFFCNVPIVVGDDIYFTDSSSRWRRNKVLFDVWEQQKTGRLLKYSLTKDSLHVIADKLAFANGLVALDSQHVLVAETTRARISKINVDTGARTTWAQLPCLPDNMHIYGENVLSVGCPAPVTPLLAFLSAWPSLRSLILRFVDPTTLTAAVPKLGHALLLSLDSASISVVGSLQDSDVRVVRVATDIRRLSDGSRVIGSYIDTVLIKA